MILGRFKVRRRVVPIACLGLLALALPSAIGGNAEASTLGLRVSGNVLKLSGTAFVPRGFSMIGALAGPGCVQPDDAAAAAHLTGAEIATLAGTWHANTLRFQVSQIALSDADPTRVAHYLTTVANAVSLARAAHLVIIWSMQDAALSCGPNHRLPSTATQQAWDHLAPVYAGAPDVMYELFNEPHEIVDLHPTPRTPLPLDGWTQWLSGGVTPDPNIDGAIGHQQLLRHIRGLGVKNVLLADGRNRAGVLPGPNQNIPLLQDTMNPPNIAYAVHPYYFTDPHPIDDLEYRFGSISETVPVIATEWNYLLTQCGTPSQTTAASFLRYLSDRGIGVLGMAGDLGIGKTLMADWTWAPTVCPGLADGPGVVFRDYLAKTQAPRPTVLTLNHLGAVPPGTPLTVTGTLLIDGFAPSISISLLVTRKDGTVSTVLSSTRTNADGTFSLPGGTAPSTGKVSFTVKYAGNGVTRSAVARLTVMTVL